MSYTHYRPPSPDRTNYVGHISAFMGSLSLQDTDPYYGRSTRDPYGTRTAGDRSLDSSPRAYYDSKRIPRTTGEGVVEARPVSSKKHNSVGQKATSKTAYVIRPRSRTSSESGRRPQIFVSDSPSRQSPLGPGYGASRAPQGYYYANDDTSRLVIPGSTRHQRVYPIDSKGRTKAYAVTGGEMRRKTTAAREPIDIDMYDSYSYTNPREQFYRDSDLIEDYRRESARRGDRTSASEFPGPQSRKDWRQSGPPPSTRGFERISVDGNRRSFGGSGYDSWGERERRRPQADPVALQQSDHGDYKDTFQNARDYRIRHAEDGTVIVEDRPYHSSQVPPQYAYRSTNDRRQPFDVPADTYPEDYTRSSHGDHGHGPIPERILREQKSWERTRDKPRPVYSDTSDELSEDDDRSRRYRKSDRPTRHSDESAADDRRDTKEKKAAVSSTAELIEDPQKKQLQTVEPKTPPKGILKTPTEKFPEDPNAVREGVAPLKDATKKGIPPNARWTKIDRRLVSPAVLEGQERYEERPDYVIVLRVLSKEEIHDYALKTAEVRGTYS